jgi:hypothetical protein
MPQAKKSKGKPPVSPSWPDGRQEEIDENLAHLVVQKGYGRAFQYRQRVSVAFAYQRQRLLAYLSGVRYSALLAGPGNGSTMTKSERSELYVGRAAVGALIALVLVWLVSSGETGGPGMIHIDPMTPGETFKTACILVPLGIVLAIAQLAWERNEFPLVGLLWAAFSGIMVGVVIDLIPALLIDFIGLHLHLHLHRLNYVWMIIPMLAATAIIILKKYTKIRFPLIPSD